MGWIRIDRSILEHWVWKEEPFSKGQAWIDLLLLADKDNSKLPYKGEVIDLKRGDVNRSILWLSDRWGWSRDKTRNFLKTLESDGMVTIKATTHRTTITIVNYGKFQDVPTTKKSTNQPTSRQQADTNKQYNKDNNIIKANKFCDFQQQEYDFEAISKMLQN